MQQLPEPAGCFRKVPAEEKAGRFLARKSNFPIALLLPIVCSPITPSARGHNWAGMWPAGCLWRATPASPDAARRPLASRARNHPSITQRNKREGGAEAGRPRPRPRARSARATCRRPGDRRISGRQSQPRPCTAPAGRRRHPRTRGAPPPTGPAVSGSDQAVTPARRTHRTQAKRSRARLWTKPSALASCPGRSGRAAPATGGTVREKTCGCVNAQRLLGY